MKKKQKAYDKGVEDGRKQMLDELMDAFYDKLADDTKKQIDEYVESFTWNLRSEPCQVVECEIK